ncbi:MAG: YbbR-like domain-containing protein [Prevotellaceae bacterium]|nr:YbbR-like domain-containing protein [Prevotellaceae bacterium]
MNDSKLFRIFRLVRNFFFSSVNREFLIFLFFFALSGAFWLLMALNETYEREISITANIVDIPKNVVLSSDTTTTVRVTVKDKGYYLFTYIYGDKLRPINIKFENYAKKNGSGVVSSSELQKFIYQQLYGSSRISSLKPDKIEFLFNYGLNKRVPVKLLGKVEAGQSYYLSKISFSPDSVDIYANEDVLDSISFIYTQKQNLLNLTDTVIKDIPLQKLRGVKTVPSSIRMSVFPDVLTEETFDVPITSVNMPEGKILRTFPSRVTVTFTVGASMFRSIRQDNFIVVADYNELVANPSEKCNIYLRAIPHGVLNARLSINQVDYLIEEQ